MKNLFIIVLTTFFINGCATTHEPIAQKNNFAIQCSDNNSCKQKSENLCGKDGYVIKSASNKIDMNDYQSILLTCNLLTVYY